MEIPSPPFSRAAGSGSVWRWKQPASYRCAAGTAGSSGDTRGCGSPPTNGAGGAGGGGCPGGVPRLCRRPRSGPAGPPTGGAVAPRCGAVRGGRGGVFPPPSFEGHQKWHFLGRKKPHPFKEFPIFKKGP